MTRKAIATRESVADAIEQLQGAGLYPTVAQVRDTIGGGSYTTISRHLSELLAESRSPDSQAIQMPADLSEIAQRAILAIYGAIQKAANARIELLEQDAALRVKRAERARGEAELEIQALEHQISAATQELDDAHAAKQDAMARADRAEGQMVVGASDVTRLRTELDAARAAAESARTEAAETRGQLHAELTRAREESARLTEQLAVLQKKQACASRASQ